MSACDACQDADWFSCVQVLLLYGTLCPFLLETLARILDGMGNDDLDGICGRTTALPSTLRLRSSPILIVFLEALRSGSGSQTLSRMGRVCRLGLFLT
jgi:hypothetical protein